MDLVYVLKDTETWWKCNELRYSLRSADAYAKWAGEVVIVTERLPEFIDPKKVIHVRQRDGNGFRTMNTLTKALAACEESGVSTQFALMNDDIIFLKRGWGVSPSTRGFLQAPPGGRSNEYRRARTNTLAVLEELRIKFPLNYATHRPQPIDKLTFGGNMRQFVKRNEPILWGTLYQNWLGYQKPDAVTDVKAHTVQQFMDLVETQDVVSLAEGITRKVQVRDWLQNAFPASSRWERS